MFMQDPILGMAAWRFIRCRLCDPEAPEQGKPTEQNPVRTVRQVADRVQESATGIADILANDTAKLQLAGFAHLLGTIYDIRFEIFQRKFLSSSLNNFLNQLTPFFSFRSAATW